MLIKAKPIQRVATMAPVLTSKARISTECLLKEEDECKEAERRAVMTEAQHHEQDHVHDVPDPYDEPDKNTFVDYQDDVLQGYIAADISHAGEDLTEDEVQNMDRSLLEELRAHHNQLFPRACDSRTRRDRTKICVDVFTAQLECLMPVVPYSPTIVITVCTLEAYCVMHLRCPCLGIQTWVHVLCDIHGVPTQSYLGTQFSIAFGLYLVIRAIVDSCVQVALGHGTPNWRLKNACPCCMYKLDGKQELEIPILATMDGNNSLKRFWTCERNEELEDGSTLAGASKELFDNCKAIGDYYLPREEVDRWAKEGLEDMMKRFVPA
ncbi:hypothetical protein B0H17DRAFT_1210723 [Mycena rosella]|uniref:CxC1-like cysteine cluster associated with KDZ transposases domain-containing protein n=1 Tax=Mycena rosella TaxID=1033263 RepID=A0AAD7G4Q9_MYCRO|nr:hypothetical protein B0H17DRAFT_1210723 [Mycena rosella]